MCKFFSAISNGKGKVLFFTVEDICKEMSMGNKNQYNWNSHTSIASFHGITGAKEDKWNKWEYDHNTKVLNIDGGFNADDDGEKVKRIIEEYFSNKDVGWLLNFYNRNSGDRNSGHYNSGDRNSGNWNSGDYNSGDWNSGNRNSGDRNSGNWNSGDYNSGYWNSGNRNSGDRNSGDRNSGNWNSGDRNSGDRNSGDRNSGDRNSGHYNSGDRNSGNWNSGDRNSGSLNSTTPDKFRIFNAWVTKKVYENIRFPDYFYFDLTQWITHDTATEDERVKYKTQIETCGGFLKTLDYKAAWRLAWDKASLEDKKKTLKLPKFNNTVFLEITGIDVKKELSKCNIE